MMRNIAPESVLAFLLVTSLGIAATAPDTSTLAYTLLTFIIGVALAFACGVLIANASHISKVGRIESLSPLESMKSNVLTKTLAAAVVMRDRTDRIIYCSPYTEVLTGYSISEILASQEDFFLKIMNPEDRPRYHRAADMGKLGEAFQFRFRFAHKTGIEIWAETRTVPVLDQSGQLESSLSITLDVTAAVRYQQQVEEKNRDLQDFTYMVSHDLKAPIFTIKGMLQILSEEHQSSIPSEALEVLEHVKRANSRLETLVTRVLEYAKISSQPFLSEPVDLSAVLSEVNKDFSTQLNECKGVLKWDDKLPVVVGDPVHIYRIFANLIGNSIKYRSSSRSLEIDIDEASSNQRRYCTIVVQDNGIGIPNTRQASLFRPFNRAHDSSVEGTGVGLAAVAKMTEKMGGSVSFTSIEGQGSTFSVSLRRQEIDNLNAI